MGMLWGLQASRAQVAVWSQGLELVPWTCVLVPRGVHGPCCCTVSGFRGEDVGVVWC